MWELQVDRSDLHRVRVVGWPAPDLTPGQALLRIPWFGFSANNITYAVLGDRLRYWDFFPRPGGYGQIPVWGFAEVVASRADGVRVGDRVFGYLPMATGVVLEPGRVSDRGFTDLAPHRAALPAPYNRYARVGPPTPEDHLFALLRPLLVLAYLLADHLVDNDYFGATRILITSASSKAARATALLLAAHPAPPVVALTSPGRADALRGYPCVADYTDVPAPDGPAVLLDFAGNATLRDRIERRYGAALVRTIPIGATHRDDPGNPAGLFFAPDQLAKRATEWGRAELDARLAAAWRAVLSAAPTWLTVVEHHGPDATTDAYLEILDGKADPTTGHVLSLFTPTRR